ncbi:MAG: hypothetical protein WCL29_07390, partial [Pseudomonadota bacterium]
EYINADNQLKLLQNSDPDVQRAESSKWRNAEMERFFNERTSFATETAFDLDKLRYLEKAKSIGFMTEIVFFGLKDEELAIKRVGIRVDEGGHPVSEAPIRRIWGESIQAADKAVLIADVVHFYDNTPHKMAPREVATVEHGHITHLSEDLPIWLTKMPILTSLISKYHGAKQNLANHSQKQDAPSTILDEAAKPPSIPTGSKEKGFIDVSAMQPTPATSKPPKSVGVASGTVSIFFASQSARQAKADFASGNYKDGAIHTVEAGALGVVGAGELLWHAGVGVAEPLAKRSGIVGMAIMVGETGKTLWKAGDSFMHGDNGLSVAYLKAAGINVGGAVAAAGGAVVADMAAGAALGSVLPGAGNVVGGLAGLGIGLAAGYAADKRGQKIIKEAEDVKSWSRSQKEKEIIIPAVRQQDGQAPLIDFGKLKRSKPDPTDPKLETGEIIPPATSGIDVHDTVTPNMLASFRLRRKGESPGSQPSSQNKL